MTLDELENLSDEEQQNLVCEFLGETPEHEQNIDNGQDQVAELWNDREFNAWLKNK